VIQLDAGIPEKFTLTLAGSVSLALLTYHFAVRRLAPLRVLFGMRAAPVGSASSPAPARGPLGGSVSRGEGAP
jgi:hypothetical protein